MITLDKFEKEVIEEISLFVADWKKAAIIHGTYEFPPEMDASDWWENLNCYDRNMPYSEEE